MKKKTIHFICNELKFFIFIKKVHQIVSKKLSKISDNERFNLCRYYAILFSGNCNKTVTLRPHSTFKMLRNFSTNLKLDYLGPVRICSSTCPKVSAKKIYHCGKIFGQTEILFLVTCDSLNR